MNITTLTIAALAIPASLTLAGATATYTDRAAFNLDAGALTIETFENQDLGQFAMPTTFASGLDADLTSGNVSSFIEAGDPDGYGFLNTTEGGRKYLRMGYHPVGGADETGSYSLSFFTQSATNAFGFNLSGFQPASGANGFNLTLLNNGQIIDDLFIPSDQTLGEARFYGFISGTDFNEFRINIPVITGMTADYVAFDDVTWAAVPSPSALSLLAMTGLAATRRRR